MKPGPTCLLLALCAGCDRPPLVTPLAPEGPAGLPGDANGDGVVDLADPVALQRHLFMGDPAPPCPAAVDLATGRIDGADAIALFHHVFSGSAPLPSPDEITCDRPTPRGPAPAGHLGWELEGPYSLGQGESAELRIAIRNADLEPGPSGWSLGVQADGDCVLEGLDLRDTVADLDGPWMRESYLWVETLDSGAISAVVPSWLERRELGPDEQARPVARVRVEATGCGSCTVRLVDGLRGRGEPVVTMITASGASYRPALPEHTFDLCP